MKGKTLFAGLVRCFTATHGAREKKGKLLLTEEQAQPELEYRNYQEELNRRVLAYKAEQVGLVYEGGSLFKRYTFDVTKDFGYNGGER